MYSYIKSVQRAEECVYKRKREKESAGGGMRFKMARDVYGLEWYTRAQKEEKPGSSPSSIERRRRRVANRSAPVSLAPTRCRHRRRHRR